MSSQIMLRDYGEDGSSDGDLRLRWENTINSPILSATYLDNAQAIADVYTFTATGSTAINITAEDAKNEHVATGVTVVADGSTTNRIMGIDFVFSASLAAGWTAKVSIGANMATDGSTEDRLQPGIILAGDVSTARRIIAENVGSEDSAETKIYATPGVLLSGTSAEDFIETIQQHTDVARMLTAVVGDYALTFADFQDIAGVKYCDILVDAVKAVEDAAFDGTTVYEHGATGYIDAADLLKGLGIVLANQLSDPTALALTLSIRDGWQYVELAPDSGGSPGTWQSPPLTVTESGEATGVITPAGYADFWVRTNVLASASPGDRRLAELLVDNISV